ncbi:hypothetical protein LQG66_08655 [Bradyrhizobium ontarionense]|uniref:Uncharacterized protein n=1 Tax=Bradyrhizobium ontarionense TaxID=2898149 RepID=A0ABY3RGA7_9BRAD|nr:hypothetical protein [Bradyrhizobium sp. A19]UFZ06351.1 hypothetical protein LQG66_08655 [Bradyrhizobium sp. A19]
MGGDSKIVLVEDKIASVIDVLSWRELASYPVAVPEPGFYGMTSYSRVGARLRVINHNFADGTFALADFNLLTGQHLASWHRTVYTELCGKPMCPFDMGDERHVAIADPTRKIWILNAETGETATDSVGTITPTVAVEDLHPQRRQTVQAHEQIPPQKNKQERRQA